MILFDFVFKVEGNCDVKLPFKNVWWYAKESLMCVLHTFILKKKYWWILLKDQTLNKILNKTFGATNNKKAQ